MRQALHIFRKDVRRLRFEVAAAVALVAAFAYSGARLTEWIEEYGPETRGAWIMGAAVLPFAWCILIARVIHAEPLPGDRQFWVTRPYEWKSLLAAKGIFIAAFVNVPLLVADLIILRAHGFPLASILPGLAAEQLVLTVLFILPFAAVSAITTGFMQLLSVCLISWVAWVVWSVVMPSVNLGGWWYAVEWVKYAYAAAVLAILSCIILLWQYARRKTLATRVLAAAGAVAVMLGIAVIPWSGAYAIQSRLSKMTIPDSTIQVHFDASRRWLTSIISVKSERVQIQAPIMIRGVPAGMVVKPDGAAICVEAMGGLKRKAADEPWTNITTHWSVTALRLTLDRSFYDKIKNQPVHLRGRVFLTLYGNRRTARVAFDGRPVPTPGLGVCSATRSPGRFQDVLLCNSAFRSPSVLASIRFRAPGEDNPREPPLYSAVNDLSYSPFPAEPGVTPLRQHYEISALRGPASWVTIDTVEPLAHTRPRFDIPILRLADFETPPGAPLLPTNSK